MFIDSYNRKVDYLRLSVTKQCNFRCQYCMPDTPEDFADNEEIPFEQLLVFVQVAIDGGVRKIRITGGEPLLRKDLCDFIAAIMRYAPQIDLALTTNGFYLQHYAQKLRAAGLARVNVSLDSLHEERIEIMSKKRVLGKILCGIDAAIAAGLRVKLNMVPIVGVNADELCDMLDFARQKKVMLRYIEFMENTHARALRGLSEREILQALRSRFTFEFVEQSGPARIYALPCGTLFGIIAPHNDDFCVSCNRVRLSAEGLIVPCLYHEDAVNVREILRTGDKESIRKAIEQALHQKPEKNRWGCESTSSTRAFYKTGG